MCNYRCFQLEMTNRGIVYYNQPSELLFCKYAAMTSWKNIVLPDSSLLGPCKHSFVFDGYSRHIHYVIDLYTAAAGLNRSQEF